MKGTLTFFLLLDLIAKPAVCIQCYSCKATAANEVQANIQCLEDAYLENCDDFYLYYNEIETQTYDDADDVDYYYDASFNDDVYKEDDESPSMEYYKESYESNMIDRNRISDDVIPTAAAPGNRAGKPTGSPSRDSQRYAGGTDNRRTKRSLKRDDQVLLKPSNKSSRASTGNHVGSDYDEYDYDYKGMENYDYQNEKASNEGEDAKPGVLYDVTSDEDVATLPKEAENYCYSQTSKTEWEDYTVEKGCKKIAYCNDNQEKLPEYGLPWNFCCDRSRCNAKQVRDKPQRIFGMGCRRDDDCIQGHNTRLVCPHLFKTCPTLSTSFIKMECLAKTRPPASSLQNPNLYFAQFQEKKCFCKTGYYPMGPICTSNSMSEYAASSTSAAATALFVIMWLDLRSGV